MWCENDNEIEGNVKIIILLACMFIFIGVIVATFMGAMHMRKNQRRSEAKAEYATLCKEQDKLFEQVVRDTSTRLRINFDTIAVEDAAELDRKLLELSQNPPMHHFNQPSPYKSLARESVRYALDWLKRAEKREYSNPRVPYSLRQHFCIGKYYEAFNHCPDNFEEFWDNREKERLAHLERPSS